MEGVIVEIHDGCVGIDLKGRLGYLKIPMRMLITDYPLVVGQEVGGLEYNFIKSLEAENNFFVGDDWQSIYGFKGGNVKIFKNLIKDKRFKTYYLLDNYRNASSIIDLAAQVIDQVDDRIEKKINVKSKSKGTIINDSKFKVEHYFNQIKREGNYGDWFILVRTNNRH